MQRDTAGYPKLALFLTHYTCLARLASRLLEEPESGDAGGLRAGNERKGQVVLRRRVHVCRLTD